MLLEPGDGPALIFDIGGGSTELVLVDSEGSVGAPRIVDWVSAPWGVVSLTESEAFDHDDPGERLAAYQRMRARVSDAFAPLARRLPKGAEAIRLLGTSGTVTTLASLHLNLLRYDRQAIDGLIVPCDAMRAISKRCPACRWRSGKRYLASVRSVRTWWLQAARSSNPFWISGPQCDWALRTGASAKVFYAG